MDKKEILQKFASEFLIDVYFDNWCESWEYSNLDLTKSYCRLLKFRNDNYPNITITKEEYEKVVNTSKKDLKTLKSIV